MQPSARLPVRALTRALLTLAALLTATLTLATAAVAAPDTVKSPTSAYRVVNFTTARGTVQVAVDIPALLRDTADPGDIDDPDEVAAYTGAFRIQGLSSGIARVQADTAYLGQPGGIIEQSRVGPLNNGTRLLRGNTRSAAGNQWWGDAGSELRYCTVRLRVFWSARLDTGALAHGTLLSNPFSIPAGNEYPCSGI
jgi:hypothetical protein